MKPAREQGADRGAAAAPTNRRGVLLGAGAAAAAGAVAALAARSPGAAPEPVAAKAQARVEDAAGYRLSEHVRRYYETART